MTTSIESKRDLHTECAFFDISTAAESAQTILRAAQRDVWKIHNEAKKEGYATTKDGDVSIAHYGCQVNLLDAYNMVQGVDAILSLIREWAMRELDTEGGSKDD